MKFSKILHYAIIVVIYVIASALLDAYIPLVWYIGYAIKGIFLGVLFGLYSFYVEKKLDELKAKKQS
ncbi:MAG: hypothetical protein LBB59_05220 [Campylobacteraceae bacterium]|nr:hypothetical protein [Campylobacteraceae bacterium]